ncbi:MAG: T9SS type A sorting domain-containing protein [Saprospiraceae bacterium]|nr:T9SS type A sorting domain-containing protein [Saprospiraceae bacterium]
MNGKKMEAFLPQRKGLFQKLDAGTYCVTVTSDQSCIATACFDIKSISVIPTEPVQQPGCMGISGSIGVRNPLPYFSDNDVDQESKYEWSHDVSLTTRQALNLSPGTYTVTVTNNKVNGNGCRTRIYTYVLENTTAPSINGIVTNGQEGGNVNPATGKIDITVIGGSSNYSFSWKENNSPSIFSTAEDLQNLSSGQYRVTVTDNVTGCIVIREFIVKNKLCGVKKIIIKNIFNNLACPVPYANNQPNACDGCPKKIKIRLSNPSDLVLPITILVTGPDNYSKSQVYNTLEPSSDILFNEFIPANFEPYQIKISDACLNNVSEEFWTCTPCRPPSLRISGDDQFLVFDGGLELKLQRPCSWCGSIFCKDRQIEIVHSNGLNVPDGLAYSIIWPRGKATDIVNPSGPPLTKKLSGDWDFELKESDYDGSLFKIKVERSDGCDQNIDLTLGHSEDNVVMGNFSLTFNAFHSNAVCNECTVLGGGNSTPGPKYVKFCVGEASAFNSFKYEPNDLSVPCAGGGSFTAHRIENGVTKMNTKIDVPTYAHIGNKPYVRINSSDPFEYEIIVGGGCLFNPIDLFYDQLEFTPIYGNWWSEIKETVFFDDKHESPVPLPCPTLTIVSANEEEIIVECINEGLEVYLQITKPNGPVSNIQMERGINKYTIKVLEGGVYYFYLTGSGAMCPPIEIPVTATETTCPRNFVMHNNPCSECKMVEWSVKMGLECKAKLVIYSFDDSGNEMEIDSKDLDLKIGLNEGIWTFNSTLEKKAYHLKLKFPNNECETLVKTFISSNVQGPGTTTKFRSPDCSDDIIDILFIPELNEYLPLWLKSDSSLTTLQSVSFSQQEYESDIHSYAEFPYDGYPISQIRVDAQKNHHILTKNNGEEQLLKIDMKGNSIWIRTLENMEIKSISVGTSGEYDLLAYQTNNKKYVLTHVDREGNFSEPIDLPIKPNLYDKMHQSGSTTIAAIKDGNLNKIIFSSPIDLIEKELPSAITVKDIKTLANGNVLVAGDFNGAITIEGKEHDSEGYKNAIFLTYDKQGNILASRSVQNNRDETIFGMATKASSEVAYHGRYQEIISYNIDPELNEIDSCIFVHIIPLTEDTCLLSTPDILLDTILCSLNWPSPEIGVTTQLQKEFNGAWINVPDANSPYEVIKNGSYRLSVAKEGCLTAVSDVTIVDCVEELPVTCHDEPIDITYVSLEQQFLYFYKTESSGLNVKSDWLSPVTYQSVLEFIEWTCEDIIIKDIRIDEQYNVYVSGLDGLTQTKTRIVKYNWSTKQVIWSQWIEHVTFESAMLSTQQNLYIVAVKNTQSSQWQILGYNKFTGVLVSSQFVEGRCSFTKLNPDCGGLRVHKDNIYTFINYDPVQLNYVAPTIKWTAPLPPSITIREVDILHNEGIVVGGDFSGTIVIDGVTYTSGTHRAIIVITYSATGQLVTVKVIKSNKHRVLKTFTTDGYYNLSYIGYYTENTNISETILLDLTAMSNHPDVCADQGGLTITGNALGNRNREKTTEPAFYPNPFSKGINLSLDASIAEAISIKAYNNVGLLIYEDILDVQQGNNVAYLEAFEKIPAGVYIIKLQSPTMEYVTRVIRIE